MICQIPRYMKKMLLPMMLTAILPACGTMGDTTAVKDANALAIACETDKALLAVDRAANSGGLSASIANLQRVVILRDAGRSSAADAAMAERNERAGANAQQVADAERAVTESLEELRAERLKQSGRRICP